MMPTILPRMVIVAPAGDDVTLIDSIGASSLICRLACSGVGVNDFVTAVNFALRNVSFASTPHGSCTVVGVMPSAASSLPTISAPAGTLVISTAHGLKFVEMKVNYFLPALEGRIFARARILRVGSTLCVGSVDLTNEKGKQMATAIVTYMLLDARKPQPPA